MFLCFLPAIFVLNRLRFYRRLHKAGGPNNIRISNKRYSLKRDRGSEGKVSEAEVGILIQWFCPEADAAGTKSQKRDR